ncbi:MAG: ImmA/IrrE family metallo-endopeptidase [Phycisphaerae bacterium]|nr:ImmA/IrrE family metallo-endopeptidase [Phycisphaerae bacterium]
MRRVERAARTTIAKCQRKLRLATTPVPIPVEEWIEGPLGIRFGVADLSHLGAEVLGAVDIPGREILVSEKAALHEGRFRFTAAHELGHFVLHAKISPTFRDDVHMSAFLDRRFEREADRFAAAFLVPHELLCLAYSEECRDAGASPGDLLRAVRDGIPEARVLFRSRVVARLSKRFGVSQSAMAHRFTDLYLADGTSALSGPTVAAMLQHRTGERNGLPR